VSNAPSYFASFLSDTSSESTGVLSGPSFRNANRKYVSSGRAIDITDCDGLYRQLSVTVL